MPGPARDLALPCRRPDGPRVEIASETPTPDAWAVSRAGGSAEAEYQRRQYPPGPKISYKAFGRDRRLPITNRWREHATPPVPSGD